MNGPFLSLQGERLMKGMPLYSDGTGVVEASIESSRNLSQSRALII